MSAKGVIRFFSSIGLVIVAVLQMGVTGVAQTSPIRLIVPFAPGGGADVVARIISSNLEKSLGQPIVIENRSGGSTIVGTVALTQAAPDGLTFGMVFDTLAIDAAFGKRVPYDPLTDIVPVIQLTRVPLVLVLNSNLAPMKTLPELVAYSKVNPGWLTFGTNGSGGPHELAFAMLKAMSKMDGLTVPYRGTNPALQDLLAGQIKGMFMGASVGDEFVRQGKLHPVAVTSKTRLQRSPDIPTIAEQGFPEYEFVPFYGIAAPKGTPASIVQKFNEEINRVLQLPEVREKIELTGLEVVGGSAEEFGTMLKDNINKMKQIVLESGVKPQDDK